MQLLRRGTPFPKSRDYVAIPRSDVDPGPIDPDRTPVFAASVAFAPRVLSALRHDRIGFHTLCPVSVYVFGSHDHFRDHCSDRHYLPESGGNLGSYDRIRGEIVTDLSRGPSHIPTTAHELAHVLMDADMDAPLWFRECVASLYEAPSIPGDGVIHGTANWRYIPLRAAVRARKPETHLGALFGMSDRDFRGKTDAGDTDGAKTLLQSRDGARHLPVARRAGQAMATMPRLARRPGKGPRRRRDVHAHYRAHPDRLGGGEREWRGWVLRTR